MKEIELVIKIPEEDYYFYKSQVADGITNPLKICIAKGIPLPKGHSDLVDRNDLLADSYVIDDYGGNEVYVVDRMTVEMADAIIKADKECEIEVVTHGKCVICGKELPEGLSLCRECEDKLNTRIALSHRK